jgi:aspartyl/asparaginyl beta-hydroxylase (cupin superfamily)
VLLGRLLLLALKLATPTNTSVKLCGQRSTRR